MISWSRSDTFQFGEAQVNALTCSGSNWFGHLLAEQAG